MRFRAWVVVRAAWRALCQIGVKLLLPVLRCYRRLGREHRGLPTGTYAAVVGRASARQRVSAASSKVSASARTRRRCVPSRALRDLYDKFFLHADQAHHSHLSTCCGALEQTRHRIQIIELEHDTGCHPAPCSLSTLSPPPTIAHTDSPPSHTHSRWHITHLLA